MTVAGGIGQAPSEPGGEALSAAVVEAMAAQRRLQIAQRAGAMGTYELIPTEGRVLVSEGFCALWGIPRTPELTLDAVRKLLNPLDLDALEAKGGRFGVGYAEYRVKRPDSGDIRWIARRGEAVAGEDGTTHHFGVCYDISERKAAEEALRRSDERLRAALEGSGAGTFRWDMNTNELEFDERLDRLFGFEPGQGPRTLEACLASIHPEDREEFLAQIERSAASGADFDMQFRVLLPGGGERCLQDRGKAYFDDSGKPLYMTGACIDVTEQTATARRLNTVLESITDSFLVVDSDWTITLVNRSAERFLGFDRREALGRSFWEVFPETRGTAVETGLREVLETHRPIHYETQSVRRPDRTIEMRVAAKEGGGVAVNFSDITERREAEQLRELLLGELNHRVKNTLAIVQATARQTFRGADVPPPVLRAFEGRLMALATAHDVLTRKNWESADLREIVAAALAPFGIVEGKRLTVEGPEVHLASQTAVSFAMALHELATNAAKYGALSNETGRISIDWATAGSGEASRLRFNWAEEGGPAVAPPARRGFGSRMIERALAAELGGKVRIHFEAEGVRCSIDAPLPEAKA